MLPEGIRSPATCTCRQIIPGRSTPSSKGGFPTHPAWYHNLKAHPTTTIELGTEKFQAKATITKDPERQRLFDAQAKLMPAFNEYQKNTTRQIPVIVLETIGPV